MIEVTDEMVQVLASFFVTDVTEVVVRTHSVAKRIIELHEANKPKPDPVGYIYPSSYAKALRNESSCKMFVVPVTNLDTGEESSLPLYTAPPTREPLSDDEISKILFLCRKGTMFPHNFARDIEQAHGIGVIK